MSSFGKRMDGWMYGWMDGIVHVVQQACLSPRSPFHSQVKHSVLPIPAFSAVHSHLPHPPHSSPATSLPVETLRAQSVVLSALCLPLAGNKCPMGISQSQRNWVPSALQTFLFPSAISVSASYEGSSSALCFPHHHLQPEVTECPWGQGGSYELPWPY